MTVLSLCLSNIQHINHPYMFDCLYLSMILLCISFTFFFILHRYPGDQYDRFWWQLGYSSPTWKNLSTVSAITQDSIYTVPLTIIQTAVEAVGNNTMLNITWQDQTPRGRGLKFFMYFADFQNSQLRQFNVSFNDVEPYQYSPPYLTTGVLYNSGWSIATDGNYNISLVPTAASKLPPMINALEIYTLISHDNPTTFPVDCKHSPLSYTPLYFL